MAADLSNFKEKMARLRQAVADAEPAIATQLSLATKALANRNVVERGFGANYSVKEIPVFFFNNKEINAGGKAYIKNQQKAKSKGGNGGLGNWKGFREAQGLQTGHVDLTYSGRMWAGILPLPPIKEGTATIAPLGGTNREVQDEMNYNRDRFGNFIEKALTPENKQTLNQFVQEQLQEVIKSVT